MGRSSRRRDRRESVVWMNHARQNDICRHCGRTPTLARRIDGTGERAIYWCFSCVKAAFGGDSFIRVSPEHLARLPLVDMSERQGSLF